jgi:hypothetical protein
MDLAQPLSSLIPSVDADVLTVLAGTEAPLTGRRISAIARRGSRPAVQAVLDRLVDHGIVLAQPAGAAVLYALNRSHLLTDPVLAAARASERLLREMSTSIERWEVPPVHASVFGSLARGDATASSDIDLFVVRPEGVPAEDETWSGQLGLLEERVRLWTGNPLSWFEIDRPGLARAVRSEEPLLESLRQDSVHLFGERLVRILVDVPEDGA